MLGRAGKVPGSQPRMLEGMAGVEYRTNSRDDYVFQIDANSPPVRTGNWLADRAQVTATFGYRRHLNSRLSLYGSYSENGDIHNYTLPGFSNIGPDITFSIGLSWRS